MRGLAWARGLAAVAVRLVRRGRACVRAARQNNTCVVVVVMMMMVLVLAVMLALPAVTGDGGNCGCRGCGCGCGCGGNCVGGGVGAGNRADIVQHTWFGTALCYP